MQCPCPSCGKPVALEGAHASAHAPFCSTRCRLLDLGAWADGAHVLPGRQLQLPPEDADDAAAT